MFFTLYLITQLAFQKHKMFSQCSEENESCINFDKGKAQIMTWTTCESFLQNTQQFLYYCIPTTINLSPNNISFICLKLSTKTKMLWAINNHFASPTYPWRKKKKKCPNHKEGTPTNNKDNLTVMFSVIFRIRQCGLSFLIWLSLSKQHYDLCLCCFVAFGYLPNAANKSGLIS